MLCHLSTFSSAFVFLNLQVNKSNTFNVTEQTKLIRLISLSFLGLHDSHDHESELLDVKPMGIVQTKYESVSYTVSIEETDPNCFIFITFVCVNSNLLYEEQGVPWNSLGTGKGNQNQEIQASMDLTCSCIKKSTTTHLQGGNSAKQWATV